MRLPVMFIVRALLLLALLACVGLAFAFLVTGRPLEALLFTVLGVALLATDSVVSG